MKCSSLEEMSEMFDREVHSQQFSVECAVSGFGRGHLAREKGDGLPCVIDVLLKDGTHCSIKGISHQAGRSIW